MKTFAEYEDLAAKAHGHLCAGQILGIRMALYGLSLLGLDDPTGAHRKRLITYVEIDRCATDAIGVVTGCRLGKRALKFLDYGKMAATFRDLQAGRAVRIYALDSSKERARALYPALDKRDAQMRAYRAMSDADLFAHQWVKVKGGDDDLPGYKGPRVVCAGCGEQVSFRREISGEQGRTLCRACAGAGYYEPL
jgi:formylmethanofuran dehydrogenase subunit E